MFKNYEKLYLDVILRKNRTQNDHLRIQDIAENIYALKALYHPTPSNPVGGSHSALHCLKRIGEQCKHLSRKSHDLCHAHPEIPWNILIVLSDLEQAPDDLPFQQAIDKLYEAISGENGLLYELKGRIEWQTTIEQYLSTFIKAEYALFHFQLKLQDVYCGLARAKLESDMAAQHAAVATAFNTPVGASVTNMLAQLDVAYQDYLDLCDQLLAAPVTSPLGATQKPNVDIEYDFLALQNELLSLSSKETASGKGPTPTENRIAQLYSAFKEKCNKYERDMTESKKENSPVKDFHVVDGLDAMLKNLQKLIDEGIILARRTIKQQDLSKNLDHTYWRLTQEERDAAKKIKSQKTRKEKHSELALSISEDNSALENSLSASSLGQEYPGFEPLLKQYLSNHFLILDDFIKKMRAFNQINPQNLITRTAQLYCLLVVGETVNTLIAYAPDLSSDERKYLRHFSECRSALVHAVDSPALLQNLWSLVFEVDHAAALHFDTIMADVLLEADQMLTFLTKRFQEHHASPFDLPPIKNTHALTTDLQKTETTVKQNTLLRYLTAIDSLLEQFDSALSAPSFNEADSTKQYAAMFMSSLLGQISKSVLEQGYAYARTIMRHPEWQIIIERLRDAGSLRATFCHNLAENYRQGHLMRQDEALPFITTFKAGLEKNEQYSEGGLLACEEKTFVREMVRNPDQGSDVYVVHCILVQLLNDIKNVDKAERVLLNPSATKGTQESRKIINRICHDYFEAVPKEEQEQLENLLIKLYEHSDNEDALNSTAMGSFHSNQAIIASPSTVAMALSPVKHHTMSAEALEIMAILNEAVINIRKHMYASFHSSVNKKIQSSVLLEPLWLQKSEKKENNDPDEISNALKQLILGNNSNTTSAAPVDYPVNTFHSPVKKERKNYTASFFSATTILQTPEGRSTAPRDPYSTGTQYSGQLQNEGIETCIAQVQQFAQSDLQNMSTTSHRSASNDLMAAGMWQAAQARKNPVSSTGPHKNKRQKVG